jgi:hypothetical protein
MFQIGSFASDPNRADYKLLQVVLELEQRVIPSENILQLSPSLHSDADASQTSHSPPVEPSQVTKLTAAKHTARSTERAQIILLNFFIALINNLYFTIITLYTDDY